MAVVFAQLDHRRGAARRARAARPDPRRARRAAAGRHDRGLRREDRPQRRRQRPHLVRPRARPAREPARPLRAGARGRHLLQPDREPDQALLHDARHAGPGPRQHRRRVDQRVEGRRSRSRPPRARAAPVRPARRRGGAAARLPHAPAPAAARAGHDLRAALRAGAARRQLHDVFTDGRRATASGASSRRSPRASRRSPPGTRRTRSRPAARRAAARAICAPTASPR